MNHDTNSLDLSPSIDNPLGEVYAFLIERQIERKVAARVEGSDTLVLSKLTDLKAKGGE